MEKLPLEITRQIGSYIDCTKDQLQFLLVCKFWNNTCQNIIFKNVEFVNTEQIEAYINKDPSLKRVTTSFDFVISPKLDQLKQIAQACPNVKSLTMPPDDESYETIDWDDIVSIIKQYWFKHLVKINLEEMVTDDIVTLLSHQLQEVKAGSSTCLDDNNQNLIPMSQLKKLRIHQFSFGEEETPRISTERLDEMRIVYPNLEELSICEFEMYPTLNHDSFVYKPFPYLQKLEIVNCQYAPIIFTQWGKMIQSLKSLILDYYDFDPRPKDWDSPPYPFRYFLENNINLEYLEVVYFDEMPSTGYSVFSKLKHLHTLSLGSCGRTDIVTRRELLDLDVLLASIPSLHRLALSGLFHLSTGEPLDSYLSGTVGYYDINPLENNQEIPEDSSSSIATDDLEDTIHAWHPFGTGESLYQSNTHIITVQKKMPQLEQSNHPYSIYTWNEKKQMNYSRYIITQSILCPPIESHPLRQLILDRVTIKNPTYLWIFANLRSLEVFKVKKTEPYPFCHILLGPKVHTFSIDFDRRYKKYGVPLVQLKVYETQKEITARWNSEENKFNRTDSLERADQSPYAIIITHDTSLSSLSVCDQSMNDVLNELEVLPNN